MTHLTTLRYFILCVPTLIRRLGSTYVSLNTCYDFDYAPYIINYFSPDGMSFPRPSNGAASTTCLIVRAFVRQN